jgi:parallel beta-helix repeat protein
VSPIHLRSIPLLAWLALGFAIEPARAASIHFAPDGDDARTLAQAQDPATPWKSLAKVGGVALAPGDSVLLRRDGIWRETLRIPRSGNEVSRIVVAPYGSGNQMPRITGSDELAGVFGADGWSAKVAGGVVARVFDGRGVLAVARFPQTGWLVAGSVEADTALSAASVASADWRGASIHLRSAMWTLETHKVARQVAGRLVPDTKAVYAYPDSVRFFLSNHPSAFRAGQDAWAFTASDSTLRWTGSASKVEASIRYYNLDLGGSSWVKVTGIQLEHAAFSAFHASGANVVIEGCRILHPDQNGVDMIGAAGQILSNTIVGANRYGVSAYGKNYRIEGNEVRLTAQGRWLGPAAMGNGCCAGRAINVGGDSAVIRRNVVDSTGYIGIGFLGIDTRVEENVVSRSCMTTDDCAGIYTWTGTFDKPGSAGSVIRRNIVRDAVGERTGWARAWEASQGIYLDDASHDIRVDSNVSVGNSIGLFLHNNRSISARGNLLVGNRSGQARLAHDKIVMADMYGNLLEDNVLVGLPGQNAQVGWDLSNPQTVSPGQWDRNTVCAAQALWTTCDTSGKLVRRIRRLDPADPRLGREALRNKGFDSTALGWTAWPGPFAKVQRDSSSQCDAGRCMRMAYLQDTTTRSPLCGSSAEFSVEAGQWWWLRFRAKAKQPGQAVQAVLRRGYGNYASLGLDAKVRLDTFWREFEMAARIKEADTRARVDFHNSATDSVWWLDDASLRRVPDSLVPTDVGMALGFNEGPASIGWAPGPGSWIDAQGGGLAGSVVPIPAFYGAVAFREEAGTGLRGAKPKSDLRIRRVADGWVFDGLAGPARIMDARGRILTTLRPGPDGIAKWSGAGSSLVWLVADHRTHCLPNLR